MARAPVTDPARLGRLRDDLAASGYTVDGVNAAIGPVAAAALHREQPLPADLATQGSPDPVAVLVQCFALGRVVSRRDLDGALASLTTDGAQALGLVDTDGDEVRAGCELRPYGDEERDWWVASDLSEVALGGPLPEDHVLGIGPASTTVASWTPRDRVGRALDLGTGCGVQALHLASHSARVTATDVSHRALTFARFNAGLAGIELDLRHGDLFDPVTSERFDLVVSNPPFVITPRAPGVPAYAYRDAGLVGDQVVERLVRSVGDHLETGGIALFIGNWEVRSGGTWRDRWTDWLAGTGLDAWVVQRDEQDPAEYAELWARDGGSRSGVAGFEHLYAAWLADFAARDVERIGFGVVALQRPSMSRPSRPPWVDLTEATGPVATASGGAMGATVSAGIRARTWLAEADDATVLDVAWRCADDVTEERHTRPGDADPRVILLRQGRGLGRVVRLDTVGAALVSVCDGTLPARAALTAIAGLLGTDTDTTVRQAAALLRGLVADGLLVSA
ncbi:methyltransferase [Lapillicoccus sp.]|uniref:DUF7059 domain-containing protein n=1 Tax=Lapillicoccus sp. TaxID=1909287 RepID=UPI003265C85E